MRFSRITLLQNMGTFPKSSNCVIAWVHHVVHAIRKSDNNVPYGIWDPIMAHILYMIY